MRWLSWPSWYGSGTETYIPKDVCSWFLFEPWPLSMKVTPKILKHVERFVSKDRQVQAPVDPFVLTARDSFRRTKEKGCGGKN